MDNGLIKISSAYTFLNPSFIVGKPAYAVCKHLPHFKAWEINNTLREGKDIEGGQLCEFICKEMQSIMQTW